jgi:predicted transposase/invertase (TIGR01784 family)
VEKAMETTKTPGRYARILLDYWFKRSFGTEGRQQLLKLFLETLIPERNIADLKYAPQEHINPFPDNKGIRVDVECTDVDGTRFVVEMQLAHQNFFYERALFNSTFAVQEQMTSGEGTYDFPAVYFIGILDFTIHEDTDRVLFRYDLRERESYESMTDRLQFIFLELTNCRVLTPESTVLEKICYALHNMENLSDRPEGFEGELFRLLFESAEIATFTPQEKTKLEIDMRTERDLKNQMASAVEKAREEGREEERARIFDELRKQGYPEDGISRLVRKD